MQCFGEIEGVPVEFTKHALKRMIEMEVTDEQVKRLILNPEEVYGSEKYPDSTCHRRGDFSMAFRHDVERGRYIVITVLYASQSAWIRADREGLLGRDRPLRLENIRHLPHN